MILPDSQKLLSDVMIINAKEIFEFRCRFLFHSALSLSLSLSLESLSFSLSLESLSLSLSRISRISLESLSNLSLESLSLSRSNLSLESLSDTIVYNGSDKLNQICCEMIVGMNAL